MSLFQSIKQATIKDLALKHIPQFSIWMDQMLDNSPPIPSSCPSSDESSSSKESGGSDSPSPNIKHRKQYAGEDGSYHSLNYYTKTCHDHGITPTTRARPGVRPRVSQRRPSSGETFSTISTKSTPRSVQFLDSQPQSRRESRQETRARAQSLDIVHEVKLLASTASSSPPLTIDTSTHYPTREELAENAGEFAHYLQDRLETTLKDASRVHRYSDSDMESQISERRRSSFLDTDFDDDFYQAQLDVTLRQINDIYKLDKASSAAVVIQSLLRFAMARKIYRDKTNKLSVRSSRISNPEISLRTLRRHSV
tara:strand:- start:487 stop:1416 length:930 start_codon:yes stop_codon:yes gene_type:complete